MISDVTKKGWTKKVSIFRAWSEGMHIAWLLFVTFFHSLNLAIFTNKVNRFKVFCVGNSSYITMQIPLKLYRCLDHSLKACILFGYNS